MSKSVKIVIVGNGFGGIYTLKYLDKIFKKDKNVEITLVGEKNYFLFTPLLHEVATGSINPANIIESIHEVLGRCLSNFYLGKAEFVNLEEKELSVGEYKLPYDYLILAPGAETNYYNIKGAEENSFSLKSLENAIKIKNHLIVTLDRASHIKDRNERRKKLSFVIVGGGPTGVELSAEMAEFLRGTFSYYCNPEIIEDISITLIQKDKNLLPQLNPKIREKSLSVLKKYGINVIFGKKVVEINPSYVLLESGEQVLAETVIWVAGIKPKNIKFSAEINQTESGKILVNDFLQLPQYPNVFALGDVAAFTKKEGRALPALAQVAQKSGKAVATNIERLIQHKHPIPFSYTHSGDLISLGKWMAVGGIHGFNISGKFTWWLWRTVYLFKLISFKKKVKVALDWTVNLFAPRDISQF